MADIIEDFNFIPGHNIDDSRFTPEEIASAEVMLAEFMSARDSSLDLSPGGTYYDSMVRPRAIVYLNSRAQTKAHRATMSIRGIQENPELASDAVLDAIMSNFQIRRKPGARAAGLVKINVSRSQIYSVSVGLRFTAPSGATFAPDSDYLALGEPTLSNHIRLYPVDQLEDQWYFLVPVTATEDGSTSLLPDQFELSVTPAFAGLISCYSFGAFSGGRDQENSQQLVGRISSGLSAKNRVSRVAIRSELEGAFPFVSSVGVQGFGDAALLRGVSGILGIKSGGFADIWVRTSSTVQSVTVEKTATMVDTRSDGMAICTVSVAESDFPGHYFISSVRPIEDLGGLGSFILDHQEKTIAAAPNRIMEGAHGNYSRHQKSEISFLIDPAERRIPEEGEEFSVAVEIMGIPHIGEIQDFISESESRPAGTDYLVRACVPCFVACSPLTVRAAADTEAADIQRAIFSHINSLGVGAPIRVDDILFAVRSVAGVNSVELPIRLAGRVFAPDGSVLDLLSENSLSIPSRPDLQVVPETSCFFAALDDIPVSVIQ